MKSDAEVRGQNDACSPVMDFQGCAEEFRLHLPQAKAGVVMGRAGGALCDLNVRNLHFPSEWFPGRGCKVRSCGEAGR